MSMPNAHEFAARHPALFFYPGTATANVCGSMGLLAVAGVVVEVRPGVQGGKNSARRVEHLQHECVVDGAGILRTGLALHETIVAWLSRGPGGQRAMRVPRCPFSYKRTSFALCDVTS